MHLDSSIRARMTASFTLAIALVMLLSCGGLVEYAHATAERNADTLLQSAARKIQTELINGEHAPDPKELLEEERDLAGENLVLLIVDERGTVLEQSQKRVPSLPAERDRNWRVVTLPYRGDTAIIGLNWEQTGRTLRAQTLGFTAIGVLVTLISALGSWLLVGRTLSPIERLARQAQTATADNLHVSLSAPSHDAEIVGLVATLNDLLARLSQTAAAKGRFYAAASHELRTPLQALSGHLELSLSKERTGEERYATIQEANAQTQRLIVLVRDLLTLNKLELAESPLAREPISLCEVCCRVLAQFAPLIESRSLRVETVLPNDVEIVAPRSHVEMLCRNLIENAVKYATPDGKVCVQYDGATLTIFNEFPAEMVLDTDALFEAFYRPDRSRHSETGGNGLGLAICKTLAETNRWHVALKQTEAGVECRVKFGSEGKEEKGG